MKKTIEEQIAEGVARGIEESKKTTRRRSGSNSGALIGVITAVMMAIAPMGVKEYSREVFGLNISNEILSYISYFTSLVIGGGGIYLFHKIESEIATKTKDAYYQTLINNSIVLLAVTFSFSMLIIGMAYR